MNGILLNLEFYKFAKKMLFSHSIFYSTKKPDTTAFFKNPDIT
jgi:hypothetical protein